MKAHDESPNAAQRREARERFAQAQRLEAEYMRALRHLTRQIDHIVKGMAPGGVVKNSIELQNVLRQYSKTIEPWARAVAEKMIRKVMRKNETSWAKLGSDIGRALRKELNAAPTGNFLKEYLETQVHLITSLPIDAAERVHNLTLESMLTGERAKQVAAEILKTGSVVESRAMLIARTEIARTAAGITMARAKQVGSTHYIWRTSTDGSVRESHKKMNGAVIPWDTEPLLIDGTRCHAGMIYNCRCWPEPILTEE